MQLEHPNLGGECAQRPTGSAVPVLSTYLQILFYLPSGVFGIRNKEVSLNPPSQNGLVDSEIQLSHLGPSNPGLHSQNSASLQ